jgi:hypothetical protein
MLPTHALLSAVICAERNASSCPLVRPGSARVVIAPTSVVVSDWIWSVVSAANCWLESTVISLVVRAAVCVVLNAWSCVATSIAKSAGAALRRSAIESVASSAAVRDEIDVIGMSSPHRRTDEAPRLAE